MEQRHIHHALAVCVSMAHRYERQCAAVCVPVWMEVVSCLLFFIL